MTDRSAEKAGREAAVAAARALVEDARARVVVAARAWVEYRKKLKKPGAASHPSLNDQLANRVAELEEAEMALRRLEIPPPLKITDEGRAALKRQQQSIERALFGRRS